MMALVLVSSTSTSLWLITGFGRDQSSVIFDNRTCKPEHCQWSRSCHGK